MTKELEITFARASSNALWRRRLMLLLFAALQLCLVMTPSIVSSEETMKSIESAIIAQVYQETQLDKLHCVFSVRRNSLAPSSALGAKIDSLNVRLLLKSPPKGLYPIIAYLYFDDGSQVHGQLTLYAQRFDSVLTVGTSTKRGQLGKLAEPIIEFSDLTKIIETPLRNVAALDNKQFVRAARMGAILTAEMLEVIPDIKPGDEVLINYQQGALFLQMRGKSLGRGVVGESIRVRNLSSRKVITGAITGVGVVTLK